jgi:hypothetical protein
MRISTLSPGFESIQVPRCSVRCLLIQLIIGKGGRDELDDDVGEHISKQLREAISRDIHNMRGKL